ncbi:MAG: GntR family transcriptional regulator [Erythrobacter sp.]|uniref:GntR family transcriptional regulator n=1 Tax=Erythrobacter sp. TaxID=1042 RepID=UPI00326598DC
MPSLPRIRGKNVILGRKLDPTLPIPLYHQAYSVLRDAISDGTWATGDQMPSEAALCETLGVSRITIKRALSELAMEGLVSRHRGRGTIVNAHKSIGLVRADFGEMMKDLLDVVDQTQVDLLRADNAIPSPQIAEELGLRDGEEAYEVFRRRLMDGEPYVYSISYIPAEVAAKFPTHGTEQTSMLQLLTDAGHAPHEAFQRMTATSADQEIAAQLDLEIGDPVLKVVRVFKTQSMRPVQHTVMYFRPDRYEYTLVLPATHAID